MQTRPTLTILFLNIYSCVEKKILIPYKKYTIVLPQNMNNFSPDFSPLEYFHFFLLLLSIGILIYAMVASQNIASAMKANRGGDNATGKCNPGNDTKQCKTTHGPRNCDNPCNANTPSTWYNKQNIAKQFYPTDFTAGKVLTPNAPTPFWESANDYNKERERQVESAQLLGKTQGFLGGLAAGSMFLFVVTLIMLTVPHSRPHSRPHI